MVLLNDTNIHQAVWLWFSDRKRAIFECGCICDLDISEVSDM